MIENYMIHPELDGDSFEFQGGKTGVLLLHGFTASTAEVRPLGESLRAAGYTVCAPLLPGHGTHPDDLNKVHWQDWLQTAEIAYQNLLKQCDHVWVGGESMGGLLCLLLAAEHAEINGLLLYAPALSVRRMRGAGYSVKDADAAIELRATGMAPGAKRRTTTRKDETRVEIGRGGLEARSADGRVARIEFPEPPEPPAPPEN